MMKHKLGKYKKPLIVCVSILLSVVLLFSVLVTVSDVYDLGFLPTWNDIFASAGLSEPKTSENELRVTFFNVGNADCTLIQTGEYTALIDAGDHEDGGKLVETLRLSGIERLDVVIATHMDADHIGGMADIVRAFDVGSFLTSPIDDGATRDNRVYENLMTALEEKAIAITTAKVGNVVSIGKARLEVLSGRRLFESGNDNSIVCRLAFGEHAFLFMGDVSKTVECNLLNDGANVEADVIKLAHHGSNTSSDERLIRRAAARYAVITCGGKQEQVELLQETLETLAEYSVVPFRSDLHGDIVFISDGETLTVETEWQVGNAA